MRTLLLLVLALAPAGLTAQPPSAEDIGRLTRQITNITGFAAKRPIPYETISREGWKQWVEEEINLQVKPEEIRAEELTLKMFGLLPEDFDLRQATVDLLTEQAAAVYDHRRKRMLFVQDAGQGLMSDMVIVHELAHALADQHFDLTRFIDKAPKSDETQAARLAVVEGQAMWIMLEAQMNRMGQSLRKDPGMLDTFSTAAASAINGMYPQFDRAPLYLRQTLMFPYMAGLHFQRKALERYGQNGFAEVLRRPPTTTREVMHPEVWLAGERPARPALPPLENPRDYKRLTEGSVGQLDFQILLTQYISEEEARRQAPLWRGGSFELLEHRKSGHPVLRWTTTWASERAAVSFLENYRRVLAAKAPESEFTRTSALVVEGENGRGRFRLTLSGTRVQGIEGLKPPE